LKTFNRIKITVKFYPNYIFPLFHFSLGDIEVATVKIIAYSSTTERRKISNGKLQLNNPKRKICEKLVKLSIKS
jgi:hypothetical protein